MDNRALLAGLGIGAAITFLFDPDRGARRRALIRDKAVRGTRLTAEAFDATARDLTNRTRGIAAATRGRFTSGPVDDARLLERVRAKIGRVCTHTHALDVHVRDGCVTLRGPILAVEVDDVLATASGVRGVTSLRNELDVHESSQGVPALQGEGRLADPSFDLLQGNWAPATQALVSVGVLAAAGAMAAYARR